MNNEVVKQRIRDIARTLLRYTRLLECRVHELDNSMNECCCDDRKIFDFRNASTEEMQILCIHCGGYIQPQDLEDCGMF